MQTIDELKRLQSQPLEIKIKMTEQRIMQWVHKFGEDGVYISFSGGKDSTVLLHIARRLYPNIKAMFVDVPTQYPELKTFAKTFENVDITKPKISFMEVCDKYGFPLISKEVSESVQGARKYLTSILESEFTLTDRQTDRQTIPLLVRTDHGDGCILEAEKRKRCLYSADRESIKHGSNGGYDNKYRKVRGIGEYTKRSYGKQDRRGESEIGELARMENKEQCSSDQGEYP